LSSAPLDFYRRSFNRQAALNGGNHHSIDLMVKPIHHITDDIVHAVKLLEYQIEAAVLQQLQQKLLLYTE
jgi:hypothetical protein